MSTSIRSALLVSLLAGAAFLGACTDEKITFRDREVFNQPVDAAQGFLGYFTVSSKTTTCGNCHVGHQRDWKQTRHADAWKTLADLGSTAQPFCFSCHTVNQNGNRFVGTGGWDAIQDSVYRDVQCESCHGPGLEHVKEPDITANHPLARAGVAVEGASCLSCHSGTHHPFAEEWKQSRHSEIVTSAATRAECASCHDGKVTLTSWGVRVNYVERDSVGNFPVTCTVCHDPHGSGIGKQLRFPIDTPDPEQNLCMRCHLRRVEPAPNSSQGTRPHAPQGAVLLGTAGYRPANFTLSDAAILTSHSSDRNPRLCAGCHVNRFTVTDPTSGNFVFQATGHIFRPDPCVDATGKPTADNSCAYTTTARRFVGCTATGCHASEAIAAQLLVQNRADIETLASQLWIDSDADGTIDAAPTDGGFLPQVKQTNPSQFAVDATITPAEGAEFNVRLAAERNQGNSDNSKGVHNPFLLKALLSASISEVKQTYGFPVLAPQVQSLVDQTLQAVRARQPDLFLKTGSR